MAIENWESTPLEGIARSGMRCVRCVETYVQLPEEQKTPEHWDEVNDAVTMVPTWQVQMAGPGQMIMACTTVPVCLDHVRVKKAAPEEIAQRNGIWTPGQN